MVPKRAIPPVSVIVQLKEIERELSVSKFYEAAVGPLFSFCYALFFLQSGALKEKRQDCNEIGLK